MQNANTSGNRLKNETANICKSWFLNTHFIPNIKVIYPANPEPTIYCNLYENTGQYGLGKTVLTGLRAKSIHRIQHNTKRAKTTDEVDV